MLKSIHFAKPNAKPDFYLSNYAQYFDYEFFFWLSFHNFQKKKEKICVCVSECSMRPILDEIIYVVVVVFFLDHYY